MKSSPIAGLDANGYFPDCQKRLSKLPKSRHYSTGLALAFLGLALSVFFWGLGYKLSLYDVHRLNSHRIPTASLLSRNEDPNRNDTALLSSTGSASDDQAIVVLSTALLLSLLLLAITLQRLTGLQQTEVSRPWRIRFRASLTAFFFRPPPAFFRL